jgi:thiol-disulfide isomerase/thioredoxin
MVALVYVSNQCPNCQRLLEQLQWLQQSDLKLAIKIVNIDAQQVSGLTAVPTVVENREVYVGTRAFEWLQNFDAHVPLNAYANGDSDSELPSTLF